jgi:ribonuclease-3
MVLYWARPADGRNRSMQTLPYEFTDARLLELALTHSSTGHESDNERLEFLGDAALDLVVAEELFRHHQGLPEGELTELKALVVSRKTLAEAARLLGLEQFARVGQGLRQRTLPRSVLANLYEAILGAVYLDGGLEAVRAFVSTTLTGPLDRVRGLAPIRNPKQRMQEISQKRFGELPTYRVVESRGEAHARAFLIAAEVGAQRFPSAWGRTRKEAENWAAHEALLVLEARGSA